MIYKSLLPIVITLIIMVTITTYLINYVNYETNEALLYENRYLVSINVFKQLNETLPSIIQNEACTLISNPINYTCETLGINTTDIIANVLGIISNRTGSIVHYEIIGYGVYGDGNETIYRATIIAIMQGDEVKGMVGASYPINLCLYSQAIKDLMNNLRANLTVYANNITEAIQIVNRDVSNRVELLGDKYVKITIYYEGVFSMVRRTSNQTTYVGQIHYTVYATPSNENYCNKATVYSGDFYVIVIINKYVNETLYFSINGLVNNHAAQ
ncbi:MAG: hypothetical protein RQ877_01800 [Vulcanisaeta sp.]|nr:hypothetical protein [Vulcanisaeta sp.]